MFIELTEEQRALQAELREYFSNLVTPEEREALAWTGTTRPTARWSAGWAATAGWAWAGPRSTAGAVSATSRTYIFANEASRADVQLPSVTLQTVGPTLQTYGTEEQKAFFLPKILAGDVHFAIGYTEPDAGTDLASLRTTAVRDGDDYVVNGQKIFTTGGHDADYIWLACRTNPDAPKHKGISILIVDTRDEGYSWTPIITADGSHHVNATYFNDVRVPASMLVGEQDRGWKLITTQLNHERVMLGPSGRTGGLRERVRDWAAERDLPRTPRREAGSRAGAGLRAGQRAAELAGRRVGVARPGGGRRRLGDQGVSPPRPCRRWVASWRRSSAGTAIRPKRTPRNCCTGWTFQAKAETSC
ncbi:acyl-CoA dehydrogenase-like protein [Saccharopolyspora dendranthemae]|uniref:Acyl-CoA dehydrogenase-like protein n=1 Tax=Saccharopolyspora dendranthemae TaxID=1181886 RepID=A0A561U6K8_9PSEU|nr:acyl-CoA dehydrogenase-like protein [Saccharopolyspora dendranthemae]